MMRPRLSTLLVRSYQLAFVLAMVGILGPLAAAQEPAAAQPAEDKSELGIRVAPKLRCPTPDDATYDKPISDINTDISLKGGASALMPLDCATDLFQPGPAGGETRGWPCLEFNWEATNFSHRPLYFDETPLERYGQTIHPNLQPVLSGVHFFGMLPLLPYKMGVDRPHDEIYTLGHYRPGDSAPCLRQRLPLEFDAATFEALTIAGLILLIP